MPVICKKCSAELPEGANFCPNCGRAVVKKQSKKQRGNGQGSVYQLANGKYKAVVVRGYSTDEKGKRHKKTRSQVFEKKKDAVNAIPGLLADPRKAELKAVTFKELYDKWLPTHRAGKSTIDCYKAAIRYLEPVWFLRMSDISLDDLQECLDDCPKGKRTKENMRAVVGLVYKYGIPRKAVPDNLNLAQFLIIEGDSAAHRSSFTDAQIEQIKKACGAVPHADAIYCMIYTGFRPSEFLSLSSDSYNKDKQTLTGGSKTQAGRGRVVTISPNIKAIVERRAASGGLLFAENGWSLKDFTEKAFYPALEQIGINNPIVEISGGAKRHKYTPHTCRHTFATLMKKVPGSEKDKLELIGHASGEMLRYYQDVNIEDLRQITDKI